MAEPRKLALLIGVSEYGKGFEPLRAPLKDVAALQRVLENPELGGFDQVTTLLNPDLREMNLGIFDLFSASTKNDLILLFFSGHGMPDDDHHLYLCTRETSKTDYLATSVAAHFIQKLSDNANYAKRQVLILDCCYSGAFAEGWRRKGDIKVELGQEWGKKGRVVLASSSSTQASFEQEGSELSLYTQYLVEGIETGAADVDRDGAVKIRELHDYIERKVREVKPKMAPNIIVVDNEGYEIVVSRVKPDAALQLGQLVEAGTRANQSLTKNENLSEVESEAPIIFQVAQPQKNKPSKTFRFEIATIAGARNKRRWLGLVRQVSCDIKYQSHTAQCFAEQLGNGITLEMVQILGGSFVMGAPETEQGYGNERPQHSVTVPLFFMSKFPITQSQYEMVMDNNPTKQYRDNRLVAPDKPVVGVTWHDAIEFCNRLSQKQARPIVYPVKPSGNMLAVPELKLLSILVKSLPLTSQTIEVWIGNLRELVMPEVMEVVRREFFAKEQL